MTPSGSRRSTASTPSHDRARRTTWDAAGARARACGSAPTRPAAACARSSWKPPPTTGLSCRRARSWSLALGLDRRPAAATATARHVLDSAARHLLHLLSDVPRCRPVRWLLLRGRDQVPPLDPPRPAARARRRPGLSGRSAQTTSRTPTAARTSSSERSERASDQPRPPAVPPTGPAAVRKKHSRKRLAGWT